MSMMKNAVDSIGIGMEDYHDDDPRRALSAIRNFYAGILLLFKCKLQELSPPGSQEALLKRSIIPIIDPATGQATWIGTGNTTVDVRDIKERLKSLGVDGIEWKRLEDLQKIRNNIEHYFSKDPADQMKEAIANALHLIKQFCVPHLGKEPIEILGQECWELLLDVASFYEGELTECRKNLESVTWPYPEVKDAIEYMRCPNCGSQLVKVVEPMEVRSAINFVCSSCNLDSSYEGVVIPAIGESLTGANYVSVKDGGDTILETCPGCGEDTFLVAQGECAACFSELEYQVCKACERGLAFDEQDMGGFCGECRYRYDKVMAE